MRLAKPFALGIIWSMMKDKPIEYESHFDELVEVQFRILNRLGSKNFQTLVTSLLIGFSAAGAVGLLLSLWFGEIAIFVGCLTAAIIGSVVHWIFPGTNSRQKMACLVSELGFRTDSFPASVWIEDERIHSLGNDTETIFELSDLREVKVDRKYLQMDFHSGGILLVPEAAFASEEQRDGFVALVKAGQAKV